jgi:hypothetical protein
MEPGLEEKLGLEERDFAHAKMGGKSDESHRPGPRAEKETEPKSRVGAKLYLHNLYFPRKGDKIQDKRSIGSRSNRAKGAG